MSSGPEAFPLKILGRRESLVLGLFGVGADELGEGRGDGALALIRSDVLNFLLGLLLLGGLHVLVEEVEGGNGGDAEGGGHLGDIVDVDASESEGLLNVEMGLGLVVEEGDHDLAGAAPRGVGLESHVTVRLQKLDELLLGVDVDNERLGDLDGGVGSDSLGVGCDVSLGGLGGLNGSVIGDSLVVGSNLGIGRLGGLNLSLRLSGDRGVLDSGRHLGGGVNGFGVG
jgi:hypothetical protein